MSGIWLFLRLVVATAVVLAPGLAIARAIGARGVAATLTWGLFAIGGALALTFLVSGSLTLTFLLLIAVGLASLRPAMRRPRPKPLHGIGAVGLAGAILGLALWHVAGEVGGDGFFHLARVEKLLHLGDLSPHRVVEFPDGGLHPGYVFPLWHGFIALVAKVSGASPSEVVVHLPTILTPICAMVVFEAARALFGRTVPAAAATAAAIALVGLSPGHGGSLTALALPATAARQLLVPVVLALAFQAIRKPGRAELGTLAASSLALAIVHPTYAIFVWLPLAGYVCVRYVWTRLELPEGIAMLGAIGIPAALFFLMLIPVIDGTTSVSPGESELERAVKHYAGQLHMHSETSYAMDPDVFGRAGAVAVGALLVIPLAGFAARRRWAAYVIGAAVAVFAITLLPALFVPFSDLVSLSQSRRFAGFLPFAFALAGGLGVLAAKLGRASLPIAFAAGALLQLLTPGDFGYSLDDGGPAAVTWWAVLGTIAALVVGLVHKRPPLEVTAGLASALFLLPIYAHGVTQWTPSPARPASPLSSGLLGTIDAKLKPGAVVYSTPEVGYRLAAVAPVFICVASPGHVADTGKNHPRERVREFRRFVRTGDLSIPRSCGAEWLILDKKRYPHLAAKLTGLSVVYQDDRWTLYRL